MIRAGRVEVDGAVETRYARGVTGRETIVAAGVAVSGAPPVVLLMNKPKKHVTAAEAERDIPGLGHYLPDDLPRVFPVGRLDVNTEGALLWTNDGLLARRILHPDWKVPKRYGIKIRGHLEDDDPGFDRFREGMTVDGQTYEPAEVRWILHRTRATWIEVTITEGKFRQLRKMCRACGYQIVKLRRLAIGPIELGDTLNPRCVRPLVDSELRALYRSVGLDGEFPVALT